MLYTSPTLAYSRYGGSYAVTGSSELQCERGREQLCGPARQLIEPKPGAHVLHEGDSSVAEFARGFALVLTNPPYFHPKKSSSAHGWQAPFVDQEQYAEWVARILHRTQAALLPNQPVCFVKTDVKYKGRILPLGFRIADCCERIGLPIRAHWIWERLPFFTPYAPSFSNIFLLGSAQPRLIQAEGVFRTNDR